MSDTPRTDASLRLGYYEGFPIGAREYVSADVARTLERELAAVTAERDALLAIKDAAQNLVAVKGRHNTAIAYERLAMALRRP